MSLFVQGFCDKYEEKGA